MFSGRVRNNPKAKDEPEKPFWISYADLMTALMVLFLVVMSVALLTVTKSISEQEREKANYDQDVELFFDDVEAAVNKFPGVTLDRSRRVIDFGSKAEFPDRGFRLTPEQSVAIREFVPEILTIAETPRGKRLLKRVIVEGFTSQKGTYLFNLNLSLQRSQSVVCALFSPPVMGESPLTANQLTQIRALFLVGGFSFNSARNNEERDRRVELRLELYSFKEERVGSAHEFNPPIGACQLPL